MFEAKDFWDRQCCGCYNLDNLPYEDYCVCGRFAHFPDVAEGVCRHRKLRSLYLYVFEARSPEVESWGRLAVDASVFLECVYDGACECCRNGSGLCCHAENKVTFEELVEVCVLRPWWEAEKQSLEGASFDGMMRLHETSRDEPCR